MTLARAHAAAPAVHSGNVTDAPRSEGAEETSWSGVLTACCTGTETTGPNANDPVLLRWRLATNSASV